MGRLMLRLLGTPEVSHAEQPLAFQTRKVLALLAYLAVEQGVHSRDKIAALLWPDSDEERSKASLRLSYLRGSLDGASHERSCHMPLQPTYVLIEHYALSFNSAPDELIDVGFPVVQCCHRTSCLSIMCPLIWPTLQPVDFQTGWRGPFWGCGAVPQARYETASSREIARFWHLPLAVLLYP
jgi:hypothetical protein